MIQKNSQTGFERRIRCATVEAAVNGEDEFYAWQWLDERSRWQNYSWVVSADLEKEFRNKLVNSVAFVVSQRSYSVDLIKMQQINDTTGVVRMVQRIKSDANLTADTPVRSLPATAPKRKASQVSVESDEKPKHKKSTLDKKNEDAAKEGGKMKIVKETVSKKSASVSDDDGGGGGGETRPKRNRKAHIVDDDDEHHNGAEGSTTGKKVKNLNSKNLSGGNDVDEEDEDDKPLKEIKSKSTASKRSAAEAKSAKSSVRTVVVKGKAPVDPECHQKLGTAHVYYEGANVYDCMLNQTNVQNNNNKYYIIQLLEDDSSAKYSVWQRWGRVGFAGQNNLVPCGSDLEKAKNIFCKKFFDKTKNEWCDRKNFEKVAGKYDLIEVDYASEKAVEENSKKKPKTEEPVAVASKLDKAIQILLQLICDVKAMETAVREMKYDADKAPLGKLTYAQIKAGYSALKKIENCIDKNSFGKTLVDACNDFYTRIPHSFGMKVPPLIRDRTTLKEKIQLLEALEDIEVAIRTLKAEDDDDTHPLDRHYSSMKCELKPLNHLSKDYEMIEKYLQNTHASTHNMYKMKLLDIFEVEKCGEKENFTDLGNKMLLWHGSRLTNWYGILSQGLRIAPPEAPVTGYMFGKGVYFADVSSKSTNYCFATKQKNVGLAVLCEVSLGNARELMAADYNADKLPVNFHSTKGIGRVAPDPKEVYTTDYGCLVPYGKPKDVGVNNRTYALNYNEYVVYNTNQIKMRYLLKIEFVFP